MTNFSDAISAYRAASRSTMMTDPVAPSLAPKPGGSFADLVKDTVKTAISANRQAEQLNIKALAGQADLRDVVTAVANAEVTLDTVVAIRDRVVSAYNEILKMPM